MRLPFGWVLLEDGSFYSSLQTLVTAVQEHFMPSVWVEEASPTVSCFQWFPHSPMESMNGNFSLLLAVCWIIYCSHHMNAMNYLTKYCLLSLLCSKHWKCKCTKQYTLFLLEMGNLPRHCVDDSFFIENLLYGEFAIALQQATNPHVKPHLNIKKNYKKHIKVLKYTYEE